MEVCYERCCGIDVHKKENVCCLRIGRKRETKSFGILSRVGHYRAKQQKSVGRINRGWSKRKKH